MRFSKNLIYLLPISLVTGPLIPEIIVIFVSLNIIFTCLREKNLNLFQNNFSILFLIFYILINISSFFSDNILLSLKTTIPYLRYYFFLIGFVYLAKNEKKFINNFFLSLVFTMICVTLSGYIEFFFNLNPIIDTKIVPHRVSGLFGDELIIGSYLSRLFPLLLVCYFFIHSEKNNDLFIFFIFLFIYLGIILSGERTAIFFGTLTIITYLSIAGKNLLQKFFYIFIFFLMTLTLIFSSQILSDRIFKETKNQVFDGKRVNVFSQEHSSHYYTAYRMFLTKPLIGYGPKSFRIVCKDERFYKNIHSCSTHPHNTYLQLLAETGLPATLFVAIIFLLSSFLYLKNFLKNLQNKKRIKNIFFYLPFIIFLFPFTPNGNFFNNWLSITNYLSISISIYLIFFKQFTNEKKSTSRL